MNKFVTFGRRESSNNFSMAVTLNKTQFLCDLWFGGVISLPYFLKTDNGVTVTVHMITAFLAVVLPTRWCHMLQNPRGYGLAALALILSLLVGLFCVVMRKTMLMWINL